MQREYTLRVRLSERERETLRLYAGQKGLSFSEVMRDLVKSLEKRVKK